MSIVLQIIAAIAGTTTSVDGTMPGPGTGVVTIFLIIWGLATIVPSLALVARRLHDVNKSGWLMLIGLVPFLGGIALLVLVLLPSNPAGQRFDPPGAV